MGAYGGDRDEKSVKSSLADTFTAGKNDKIPPAF